MFDFENYIPTASQDAGEYARFWKASRDNKACVPFCGNDTYTGHAFLNVLRDLTELSDSFAACLKFILNNAFGGEMGSVSIIEKDIPGLSIPEDDSNTKAGVSKEDQKRFASELSEMGISLTSIIKATRKLKQHEEESGNNYLKITVGIVNNQVSVSYKVLHYLHTAYRYTKKGKLRKVAICKDWRLDENNTIEWEEQFVSKIGRKFNWKLTKVKDGERFETVVHHANEIDESNCYGRPWIRSVLDAMLSEHKLGELRCKVDSTETVSKHGIAVKKEEDDGTEYCDECDEGIIYEDEDDKHGRKCGCTKQLDSFEEKALVVRRVMTNEGSKKEKPSSVFMVEYDDEAPTVLDFAVNRDTNWYLAGITTNADKIHKNMGVPRQLAFDKEAKGGQGANMLPSLYIITNCQTIQPVQTQYENYHSWIFNEISDITNIESLRKYGIKFPDKITPLVDALKALNSGNESTNDTE